MTLNTVSLNKYDKTENDLNRILFSRRQSFLQQSQALTCLHTLT